MGDFMNRIWMMVQKGMSSVVRAEEHDRYCVSDLLSDVCEVLCLMWKQMPIYCLVYAKVRKRDNLRKLGLILMFANTPRSNNAKGWIYSHVPEHDNVMLMMKLRKVRFQEEGIHEVGDVSVIVMNL